MLELRFGIKRKRRALHRKENLEGRPLLADLLYRLGLIAGMFAINAPLLTVAEPLQVEGDEISLLGELAGEQVHPSLSLRGSSGMVAYEDNLIDGNGSGIGGAILGGGLTPTYEPFRVNSSVAGDQLRPQVLQLPSGGAAFVWECREDGNGLIRARFMDSNGTFFENDFVVSSSAGGAKRHPKIALAGDNQVVVVWDSFGQDDVGNASAALASLQGVYGRLLDFDGSFASDEFLVNQSVVYNQRDPDVIALMGGGFAVSWVGEGSPEMNPSAAAQAFSSEGVGAPETPVDVYLRVYDSLAQSVTGEIKVNQETHLCANPVLLEDADGDIVVAWSQNNLLEIEDGWDVYRRVCSRNGSPMGDATRVNSFTYGDQFRPKLARIGAQDLIVWTSMGQDGSFEGVFGQLYSPQGATVGEEFQINDTSIGKQIFPTIGSGNEAELSVIWSSYKGGGSGFDLAAKSYFEAIPAAPTPYVNALTQSKLGVAWPEVQALLPEIYLLYMDGDTEPVEVDGIYTQISGLVPGSEHSFRLAYRLPDGRVSPLSEEVIGKTLGEDDNFNGLPDDWEARYFGSDSGDWPGGHVDSDGDGASNLEEFWAGTSPTDPDSVLKQQLLMTESGLKLRWNTLPGLVYQLEQSADLSNWVEMGKLRFSHAETDEVGINLDFTPNYFRVRRLR